MNRGIELMKSYKKIATAFIKLKGQKAKIAKYLVN